MQNLTRRGFLGAAGVAAAGLVTGCAGGEPTGNHDADTTAVSESAWADLKASLRGSLLRPGEAGYIEAAIPRNLRFAADMPGAVVLCDEPEDVVASLAWTRKTNTSFAIRGGGHNYTTASSSRGIIISTRRMNTARIDGSTLIAQAGVLNADLAKLLPQGGRGELLLPGGNCPGVGVAGLTLGGGIGPNAPWAGLTADRLRGVTMVTADGDIVTSSATENPDLFWGLRGGAGGNFGAVTELEYELVEVPVTRATTAKLTFSGRDAALAAALAFQRLRAEAERTSAATINLAQSDGDVDAVMSAQLLTGEKDARDLLTGLLSIPGVKAEIAERTWWDAYGWYVVAPRRSYFFWDRSLYADEFLSEDALSDALDVVRRFPAEGSSADRDGSLGLFGWVGGAVSDVAPGDTAYVHRASRSLIEMTSKWVGPSDPIGPVAPIPPEIRDWQEQLWETVLPHTTGRSYQNFPDPELPEWADAYYGANRIGLENIKKRWDPDDVFTHFQAVPLPR